MWLLLATASASALRSNGLLSGRHGRRAITMISTHQDDLGTMSVGEIISASLDRYARRLQVPPISESRMMRLAEATPDDWRCVVDALAPAARPKKVWSLEAALRRRRARLHLVVENISDPRNAAAVCRAAEGLGVQHLHVVESVNTFEPLDESAMASSTGGKGDYNADASRWLTIRRYRSAADCIAHLHASDVQKVYASDCPTADDGDEADAEGAGWVTAKLAGHVKAEPLDELDFSSAGGTALVFGSERRGVSRAFIEGSDGTFYLPMAGFTQSFNIGVALVMSLSGAIASGRFPEGTLPEDIRAELMGRWLLRDIKSARSLLLQAGLEFEDF